MMLRSLPAVPLLAFAFALSAQAPVIGHVSELKGTGGAVLGKVTVTSAPRGVLIRVEATGLPPGFHGVHLHEKGDCSDPVFKSAGAHVHSTTPVVHGLLNADANDSGDLPNLYVAADGSATIELYSTLVTLQGGDGRPALLDADGSALVIHASPDDYRTQPIGGSGARIACAVIH